MKDKGQFSMVALPIELALQWNLPVHALIQIMYAPN
jgi:hypothetical protein